MAANTLPDPVVRSNLARFACVALDLDANQAAAQQRGVSASPAFLVLNSAGDVILRMEGYRDATQFNAWLEEAVKTAHAAAQKKVSAFLKQQDAIATALKSSDAAARRQALADLLNLCADREPSHQHVRCRSTQGRGRRRSECAARWTGAPPPGHTHCRGKSVTRNAGQGDCVRSLGQPGGARESHHRTPSTVLSQDRRKACAGGTAGMNRGGDGLVAGARARRLDVRLRLKGHEQNRKEHAKLPR